MKRTIMMGMALVAGCATVGKVGPNTTNYQVWYKDCGVSKDIPSNIEVFKGEAPGSVAAIAKPDQLPNPRSNVKGVLRVIVRHPEACNGKGVEVADLIPEPPPITPAAVGTPRVYQFKRVEVSPDHWNE